MSKEDQPDDVLGETDVAVIARYAGLTIPSDRLAQVARELNLAQSAADDLLAFPSQEVSAVPGPFDPAWPAPRKRGAR